MNLQTVVDLAQVVASATVIGGTFFGLVQFKEFRKQRQETIAGDLMHSFMSAEFTSALATLMRLPDGVTIEELTAAGPDTEKAAVLVETTFETMGLLVFEGIAPFQLVSKLAGGTILQMWRKLGPWVAEIRTVHSNPFDGEWFQWLAELCEQSKSSGVPAYLQYRGFVPS